MLEDTDTVNILSTDQVKTQNTAVGADGIQYHGR